MVSAYRIGRIAGRWENFTPPIRGGIFDKQDRQAKESSGKKTKDVGNGLGTGVDSSNTVLAGNTKETKLGKQRTGQSPARPGEHDAKPNKPTESRKSRIEEAIQKEINDCLENYPSLDPETQGAITHKYQELQRRVNAEGFYDCRYSEYLKELVRYVTLFSAFMVALRCEWYLTSAAFLGLFWHQIMFTAHDAGHRGITHNFIIDTLIGIFVADFCCGLSIGWWKSSHNVHHLVTNDPKHDPDIQNVPLFATCPTQFEDTRSSYYDFTFAWDAVADTLVPFQRYTYYPVMAIARFNLYLLSWLHLLSARSAPLGSAAWTRPAELVAMSCYWYIFGYNLLLMTLPSWPMRVAFVLISHTVTCVLHVQITLSHWGMPTADLGDAECFAQRQLRTTADVACPEWLDWLHGGLQFQVIHHLFPRVPRHNLRRLQPLVKQLCHETGIRYNIYGFLDGNAGVLARLDEISRQLKMLGSCSKWMAETGASGLL